MKWQRIVGTVVGKGIAKQTRSNIPFSLVDMNALLHFAIDGQPINENTLIKANLAYRLGIDTPFTVTLADETKGEYLVRSSAYPSTYLSIFGKVPFADIPYESYKDIAAYLIANDQYITKGLLD